MKMVSRLLEKPWGQPGVTHGSPPTSQRRIGEVCFEHPERQALPVMIKYLYTSERLSIQVHPDDQQARAKGHACGKDEMWIVLDAAPGATIGLGLKREVSRRELQQAMVDGTMEELVDWRPVSRGDVIYNRAGTIHAAGDGLVLLEIQQAADLTYRLYDYGRARELHIEDGLSVARGEPHRPDKDGRICAGQPALLVDGPHFGAAWCDGAIPAEVPANADHYQLVVVEGAALAAGSALAAGECGLVTELGDIRLAPGTVAALAWPVAREAAAELARAA